MRIQTTHTGFFDSLMAAPNQEVADRMDTGARALVLIRKRKILEATLHAIPSAIHLVDDLLHG